MVNGTARSFRSPFTIHYSRFTALQVLYVQLQFDITIPAVSFQFIREIEALVHCRRSLRLFNSTPPDCFEWPIVVAGHAQLQMLLFNDLRLAQYAEAARHKQRPR